MNVFMVINGLILIVTISKIHSIPINAGALSETEDSVVDALANDLQNINDADGDKRRRALTLDSENAHINDNLDIGSERKRRKSSGMREIERLLRGNLRKTLNKNTNIDEDDRKRRVIDTKNYGYSDNEGDELDFYKEMERKRKVNIDDDDNDDDDISKRGISELDAKFKCEATVDANAGPSKLPADDDDDDDDDIENFVSADETLSRVHRSYDDDADDNVNIEDEPTADLYRRYAEVDDISNTVEDVDFADQASSRIRRNNHEDADDDDDDNDDDKMEGNSKRRRSYDEINANLMRRNVPSDPDFEEALNNLNQRAEKDDDLQVAEDNMNKREAPADGSFDASLNNDLKKRDTGDDNHKVQTRIHDGVQKKIRTASQKNDVEKRATEDIKQLKAANHENTLNETSSFISQTSHESSVNDENTSLFLTDIVIDQPIEFSIIENSNNPHIEIPIYRRKRDLKSLKGTKSGALKALQKASEPSGEYLSDLFDIEDAWV